ncbi:non-structural maintenance of chromosomes element 3 homolog [Arctopsyche grandis]|uniref:non-structural maintenance of chromosomes element 3 homolog n=1 Tax=Arctopsyche grandis TaxID=121162 RepID=UPI00406D8272
MAHALTVDYCGLARIRNVNDEELLRSRIMSSHDQESDHNLNIAEKACCRFLLTQASSRIPIKRTDIASHLHALDKTLSSSAITEIIRLAAKRLRKVYRLKLHKISSKSNTQYILIYDDTSNAEPLPTVIEENKTLLIVALAHIFMSGGSVKEDDMWRFLEKAGVIKSETHYQRKILTQEFTKELYLNYNKVNDSGITRYIFEWGERATVEMPKLDLLKSITQAFDRPQDYWFEQFKTAQNEDLKNFPSRNENETMDIGDE